MFLVFLVSATCEENQVNINTASLSELDEIYGIGSAKAQAIINYRSNEGSFEILEELINVYGIGEKTLENIKAQGLACVNQENEKEEKSIEENNELLVFNFSNTSQIKDSEKEKTIKLNFENSKDIKTEGNFELSETDKQNKNYPLYVFLAFCVLIIGLSIAKKLGKNKNEFG